MLASPPLRGLRDRFAHPYQTWYECAVKATTFYRQGAMLAPIRLTNAGSCPSRQRDCVATAARSAETKGTAQLVLRTQVRRKETHPPLHPTPAPTRFCIQRFAHPYDTKCRRASVVAVVAFKLLLSLLGRGVIAFSNSTDFFGNVNANRAPGDAPAASHASRGAKLVNPGAQFMGHPLAIA